MELIHVLLSDYILVCYKCWIIDFYPPKVTLNSSVLGISFNAISDLQYGVYYTECIININNFSQHSYLN